jgi:hypothetical protein
MFTIAMTLSIASSALRLWLIGRVCLVHRQHEYPLFIAHNVAAIVTLLATICLRNQRIPYFFTYWIGEATATILALLVILAIFKPAAEVLYIESPRRRFILSIPVAAVIAVPVWQAIYRPLGLSLFGHLASGIYSFVLAILCVEALILVACLTLSRYIPWGRYDLAIVSGFGISAMMKCVAYLVRWNYGSRFEDWFKIVLPASTLGAVLVWLIAFSRTEPKITKQEPDLNELDRVIALLREDTEFVRRILKFPPWRRQSLPIQPRRPFHLS